MANQSKIVVSGAREHNLKDVSLELPRDALVVITGLSGSGKSSLAFDTIYAEGQRRYVESLSAYARQFLGQMDKPDVDSIEGLSPAISIDQKTTSRNPRSTVGTVTEIYDYLRLLWSRIGKPHCHVCGAPIEGQSVEQIVDRVLDEIPERGRFMVLAPIVRGRKGEYGKVFEELRGDGYSRALVNGELRMLDEEIQLDKRYKHDIAVVVDRLVMRAEVRKRLTESVEAAVGLADGLVEVQVLPDRDGGGEERTMLFSERFACLRCGTSMPELEPRIFSFNSPHGACTRCTGLGTQMEIDPELVVPDPDLSINAGALLPWANSAANYYEQLTEAIAETYGVDLDVPWRKLPEAERDLFLYGTAGERVKVTYRNRYGRTRTYQTRFEGIVPNLERRYKETDSEFSREKIEEYMSVRPCPECHGSRLRPESRSVLVSGMAIHEFTGLSVRRARTWVDDLELSETDRHIARLILREIDERLRFLDDVGHRLPVDGPRRRDAVGRRGPADPAGDADRLGARGRPVRARRAVDRPAPAGQLEAHRRRSSGCATSGTRCSSSSTTSRRCGRPTTSSTSARARASTAGGSSRTARRRRSRRSRSRSPGSSCPGSGRSRCRRSGASRPGGSRSSARGRTT